MRYVHYRRGGRRPGPRGACEPRASDPASRRRCGDHPTRCTLPSRAGGELARRPRSRGRASNGVHLPRSHLLVARDTSRCARGARGELQSGAGLATNQPLSALGLPRQLVLRSLGLPGPRSFAGSAACCRGVSQPGPFLGWSRGEARLGGLWRGWKWEFARGFLRLRCEFGCASGRSASGRGGTRC